MNNTMFIKTVSFVGNILDSHLLSKVLDEVLEMGGDYEFLDLSVGHKHEDASRAKLCIRADDEQTLNLITEAVILSGGNLDEEEDIDTAVAPADGVFPEGFYSTTNLETCVRIKGEDIKVEGEAMDLGICVDIENKRAFSVPMTEVEKGQTFVVGAKGVKIVPLRTSDIKEGSSAFFGFMKSEVSVEKPRRNIIEEIASSLKENHKNGKKNLLVLGPAVVHSGASEYVAKLIKKGVFDILFGGNAVAAHDIENSLYGTSLGISLKDGKSNGHQNHLRAINKIRSYGSIKEAIDKGIVSTGIMHASYTSGIEVFLAGSIRDDGPLPEVCTDVVESKKMMREMLNGVGTAVMVATALHSIATGNLLPANVRTFCVDINPDAVTKLMDRGSLQSSPLVMDCESFFYELLELID